MTTPDLLAVPTRFLFFTGKGGVGKTSLSCAIALSLADSGKRVLLVSTDPASNLDEMLGVALSDRPTEIPGAPGLLAMNIDPDKAAEDYRLRVIDQLGRADRATVREQLSSACTTEIAAFDEFVGRALIAKLLDPRRGSQNTSCAKIQSGPLDWHRQRCYLPHRTNRPDPVEIRTGVRPAPGRHDLRRPGRTRQRALAPGDEVRPLPRRPKGVALQMGLAMIVLPAAIPKAVRSQGPSEPRQDELELLPKPRPARSSDRAAGHHR